MAKYPGEIILNEIGSRADMAKAYGVSERTIYRWLNKAADESGIKLRAKARRPRTSTLEKFTGTRKQLAKKYGVSERTAYRWLKKAREAGAQLPSKSKESKYPGADVINNLMRTTALTNKQIGEMFDVSPETAGRWIRKAKLEIPSLVPDLRKTGEYKLRKKNGRFYYEKVTPEPEDIGEPWEVPEPEDVGEPWEVPPPDEDIGEPWEVPESEYEYQEEFADQYGVEESLFNNLVDIAALLQDTELIDPDSKFWDIDPNMRIIYLSDYISYQADRNPKMFYEVTGEWGNIPLDNPELIASVNIWGEDFNFWLEEQIDIDNY